MDFLFAPLIAIEGNFDSEGFVVSVDRVEIWHSFAQVDKEVCALATCLDEAVTKIF